MSYAAVLSGSLAATASKSLDRCRTTTGRDNMATFTTAVAELVPVLLPDILFRLISAGNPFPEFAAVIKPTTFARGRRPPAVYGTG
jgi:hypothetical protein